MKIILLKDVKNVGRVGQLIEVANGYARNFLIPTGLGKFADSAIIQAMLRNHKIKLVHNENQVKKAEALAKKLKGARFEMTHLADDKGSFYASLKESEILTRIKEVYKHLPENAKLLNYTPIKSIGEHKILLEISSGIPTNLTLTIKRRNGQT